MWKKYFGKIIFEKINLNCADKFDNTMKESESNFANYWK